jgi:hypothetical protein
MDWHAIRNAFPSTSVAIGREKRKPYTVDPDRRAAIQLLLVLGGEPVYLRIAISIDSLSISLPSVAHCLCLLSSVPVSA